MFYSQLKFHNDVREHKRKSLSTLSGQSRRPKYKTKSAVIISYFMEITDKNVC